VAVVAVCLLQKPQALLALVVAVLAVRVQRLVVQAAQISVVVQAVAVLRVAQT
jgi:hypothetical protein